jgi:hypothetical protein
LEVEDCLGIKHKVKVYLELLHLSSPHLEVDYLGHLLLSSLHLEEDYLDHHLNSQQQDRYLELILRVLHNHLISAKLPKICQVQVEVHL